MKPENHAKLIPQPNSQNHRIQAPCARAMMDLFNSFQRISEHCCSTDNVTIVFMVTILVLVVHKCAYDQEIGDRLSVQIA